MSIWDFRYARTAYVFGAAGSGKSVFARHVAKTWVREGGTVIIGGGHYTEYEDLLPLVYLCSADDAVEYGRMLEQRYTQRNAKLIIVVDCQGGISEENQEYLHSKPVTNICWMVLNQRVRNTLHSKNIGMGRVTDGTIALAFGQAYVKDNTTRQHRPGMSIQLSGNGGLVERTVPKDAIQPFDDASKYHRDPLPVFPRRVWYAGGKL